MERLRDRLRGWQAERSKAGKERETEKDQKILLQRDGEADSERKKESAELETMCLKQRQRETDWETYWDTHIQGDSGRKSNTGRESRGRETHQKRQGKRKWSTNWPRQTSRDQKDMESDEKWREREKREPMRCTGRETVRLRDGWGAKKKVRKRESVTDIETGRRTDPERNWKRERRGEKGRGSRKGGGGRGRNHKQIETWQRQTDKSRPTEKLSEMSNWTKRLNLSGVREK